MMNPVEMTVPFPVVEAMTWQLAAEIIRRHPELWAVRTEFQDGFYNMVTLRPLTALEPDIAINKGSSVLVGWFGDSGQQREDRQMNMRDYLVAQDPRDWILELERRAGLTPPASPLPASTPNSLAVRWVGAFTTAQMNSRRVLTPETHPGWLTTPEAGEFPATAAWARTIDHPAPGTLTIFLEDKERDDRPAAAISASGTLERPGLEPIDLPTVYQHHDRSLISTLAATAAGLLP